MKAQLRHSKTKPFLTDIQSTNLEVLLPLLYIRSTNLSNPNKEEKCTILIPVYIRLWCFHGMRPLAFTYRTLSTSRNSPASSKSSTLSLKAWWWVPWNTTLRSVCSVLFQSGMLTFDLCVFWPLSGSIQEPPGLPAHCHQAGAANHPLYAPPP